MIRAAAAVLALALVGCDHEPQLAVARASLHDDVPPAKSPVATGPVPWPPPVSARAVDPLAQRLKREITARNALPKARELEERLDREIEALQAKSGAAEPDASDELPAAR